MSLYLETLCLLSGAPQRLAHHQARLNATLACEASTATIDLAQLLRHHRPQISDARLRCRVLYDASGVRQISFHRYQPRLVQKLRMLRCDTISYSRKFADRSALDALHAQRGEADDVLIVRQGLLTDTTIANVAFFDGTHWLTPSQPLLCGTHRAALLANATLIEAPITPSDLAKFQRLRLFNAMLEWGEIELPVSPQTLVD